MNLTCLLTSHCYFGPLGINDPYKMVCVRCGHRKTPPIRLTDRGILAVLLVLLVAVAAFVWLTRDTCWVGIDNGWYGSCKALVSGGSK